jgi:hypothetical protein
MICRIWRGWTSKANAQAYEKVVRGIVIPGIEAKRIAGFRHIDLMRRELDNEYEFTTLMWFDSLDAVKAFMARTTRSVTLRCRPARSFRASMNARRISTFWTGARRGEAFGRPCVKCPRTPPDFSRRGGSRYGRPGR